MKDLINSSYKVLIGANISETVELDEAFDRLPGHVIGNELFTAHKSLTAFLSSQQNGNDVDIKKLNQIIKDLQDIKKQVKKFNKPEEVPVSYQYKESTDLKEAKLEKPKGTPLEIQNQLGTMIAKAKTIKGISDDEYMSWYSNLDDKTYDRWEKMVKADPQYKKAYTLGTQGGSDKPPFPKGTFAAAIWSNEYAAGAMDN